MKRKKILFVYSHWQSFVREDYQILSENYAVKKLQFSLQKSFLGFFLGQLQGLLNLLIAVPKHDMVYIWFCDYHAFWSVLTAKIFRKKSVVVVGGFDAVKIPSIDYGLFLKNNLRTQLAKWAYKYCDKIVAVDASLIQGKNDYAGKNAQTGVAHFVPGIQKKSMVIPTGYDADKWKISTKKEQVLTVGLVKDQKVFLRKGVDLYLEIARQLPHYQFIIIGLQDKNLIPNDLQNLPNLKILPIVAQEEIIQYYAESKVYCQFSVSEGLPNVLCEAMMSGCIPVGSSANGIPLAIGDCGYVLEQKNITQATTLVLKAMQDNIEKSRCARERIQRLFPKDKRKELLFNLIQSL